MASHVSSMHNRNKKIKTSYVSEFSDFMTHYLDEHPEVIEDQRNGRAIYWDHKVNLTAYEKAEKEDGVSDDRYGFDYTAGRRKV